MLEVFVTYVNMGIVAATFLSLQLGVLELKLKAHQYKGSITKAQIHPKINGQRL